MRRDLAATGLAAAALAMLALPSLATAKVTELGEMPDDLRGSCPENCQALTRTTGYQAKIGPDRGLYQAPANGRIVAWSVALGNPGPKQVSYFQERYGGTAQAALVVLDPGKKLSRRVTAKAPLKRLTPYFGQKAQFPLERTLPIRKGQYVALTVPTWAPTLQIGLGSDTSWRSSRAGSGCLDLTTQFAMLGKRTRVAFRCLYRTARLTYGATFVSSPKANERPERSKR
jgi:hypothetical protein